MRFKSEKFSLFCVKLKQSSCLESIDRDICRCAERGRDGDCITVAVSHRINIHTTV